MLKILCFGPCESSLKMFGLLILFEIPERTEIYPFLKLTSISTIEIGYYCIVDVQYDTLTSLSFNISKFDRAHQK